MIIIEPVLSREYNRPETKGILAGTVVEEGGVPLKILIIRPAALGDTLMLIPALSSLRDSVSVILAGRTPGIHYLRRFVERCLDFEGAAWHTLFTENPEVEYLPSADIIVGFFRDMDGTVRRNLGALFPHSRVHLFRGLPEEEGTHVALYLARRLRSSGLDLDPEECVGSGLTRPLFNGSSSGEKKTILLHPGSGSLAKNHPPEFWLDLSQRLREHPLSRGLRPLFLLGPAEEGLLPFFSAGVANRDGEIRVCPGPDELISLLRAGSLYVGHDSGVTHLAAMLGVPTIALFRSTSVTMWKPLGPNVTVILGDMPPGQLASTVLAEAERSLGRS